MASLLLLLKCEKKLYHILSEPPRKRRKVIIPGVTGLRNLGNTCYMNSVLQVLRWERFSFKSFFMRTDEISHCSNFNLMASCKAQIWIWMNKNFLTFISVTCSSSVIAFCCSTWWSLLSTQCRVWPPHPRIAAHSAPPIQDKQRLNVTKYESFLSPYRCPVES